VGLADLAAIQDAIDAIGRAFVADRATAGALVAEEGTGTGKPGWGVTGYKAPAPADSNAAIYVAIGLAGLLLTVAGIGTVIYLSTRKPGKGA
jgi:hypothetical protein